jgi:hypothetical protein
LREHFDGSVAGYARAIEIITDQIAEAATVAECQRRGDGLLFVLDQLSRLECSEPVKGAKRSAA